MAKELGPRLSSHDKAIEKMRQFIVGQEIDRVKLNGIERIVFSGVMQIRREHGLVMRPTTEQTIVDTISRSLYFASAYLKSTTPDRIESLSTSKVDEAAPAVDANVQTHNTIATWSRSDDCPNGVVKYWSYFIKESAENIEGFGAGDPKLAIHALSSISAHELFHGHEYKDYRKTLTRDLNILEGGGDEAWHKTSSEWAADLFGEIFADAYMNTLMEKPQI